MSASGQKEESPAAAARGRYAAGVIIVLISSICYATKAIFVKLAYRYQIDPITTLTLRMLFSAPFFAAPLFVQTNFRDQFRSITPRDLLNIAVVGACGFYLSAIFDFTGLQYISASLERIILFSYPTIVLLSSWLLFGTRVTSRQAAAVITCYAGVALSFWSELHTGGGTVLHGSLFVAACAFTYAFFLIGSGRLIPKVGPRIFASLSMLAATVAVLIHFLITNPVSTLVQPAGVYLLIGLMALISTVIPSFMLSSGIGRIGSNVAAIVGSIGPVATIVMATAFLGEPLTAGQLWGSGLVIIGVVLVGSRK